MTYFGSRLIIGIEGQTATDTAKELIDVTKAAGVILFAKNLVDADQAETLITALRTAIDRPLIFAVDQEEGAVIRLARGLTVFPGNASLGRADDLDLCRAAGQASADQMARLGFDLVLAPVVDRRGESSNPITGNRSFGSDAGQVVRLAGAYLQGMKAGGVAGCLKHFPGLSGATVDPHLELPVLAQDLDSTADLSVFRDLFAAGDSIMTTHVLMKSLDPSEPATFSRPIVQQLLRYEMGYDGVILSDDMTMGGANRQGGLPQALIDALRAGHDAALICHDPQAIRAAAQALQSAGEQGQLDRSGHEDAVLRLSRLRRRTASESWPPPDNHEPLAFEIASRGLQVLGDPRRLRFFKSDRIVVLDGFWTQDRVVESGCEDLAQCVAAEFVQAGFFETLRCHDLEELSELRFDRLVIPVARTQAIQSAGEKLQTLQRTFPDRAFLILLGPPSDQQIIRPETVAIDLAGSRRVQLQAAIAFLAGNVDSFQ